MVLTQLPVIPPDLRPVVQLEWGRFASSDVNLFYRRVLMRNMRLKKMIQVWMPDVVKKNEIRLLQESVNNLLVWEKAGTSWSWSWSKVFKALTDMLSGKEWIFRKNLLGKRVDYSWRSVITVWPHLKLDECWLPLYLAVKMFTPFIIGKLIERKIAHTPRQAEKLIKEEDPITLKILEKVIEDKYVLLNRAPTLHRLSIQAFKIKLMPGKTIRIHPLVCPAFNADFDGDQMAVHLPLSPEAQHEAKTLIASVQNVLKPASGEPVISHSQDMVVGSYYLTDEYGDSSLPTLEAITKEFEEKWFWKNVSGIFDSLDSVLNTFESWELDIKARILLVQNGETILTTVWRVVFNSLLPEKARFINEKVWSKQLKWILDLIFDLYGKEQVVATADDIKDSWFKFATQSSVTINIFDLKVPNEKKKILDVAGEVVNEVHNFWFKGFLSDEEKHRQIVALRSDAKSKIESLVKLYYQPGTDVYSLIDAKARWNRWQMTQMAGMKWLVSSPSWKIIELPIKSSLLEWFSPIEYFISAHGARKGKADTALRTAESWYLTRRLVDASQEVIVRVNDCGTENYILISTAEAHMRNEPFDSLIFWRVLAEDLVDTHGKTLLEAWVMLSKDYTEMLIQSGIEEVKVRSSLTCNVISGVCQRCFGMDLSTRELVEIGSPAWVISSQSIGEPGTQLTMRTFHSWWVASTGWDMTQGIRRVDELFEVRNPKKPAIICPFDGRVEIIEGAKKTDVIIISEPLPMTYIIKEWYSIDVNVWDEVTKGWSYAVKWRSKLKVKEWGIVLEIHADYIVLWEIHEVKKKLTLWTLLKVKSGQEVFKWQVITTWWIDLREYMKVVWALETQRYIVKDIKRVYTSQGQDVNDKYMETIVKQLFSKVMVEDAGESSMIPGTIVKYEEFLAVNEDLLANNKQAATWERLALWLTQVAKESESRMSSASFQETIRVMVEASTKWQIDPLSDLKANVIIGRLLPVWTIYKEKYEKSLEKWWILDGVIM